MRITLYFINWNDSYYLPFIAQHYGKFCQRIVMYDNYSTDNSQQIALFHGFEVREFGRLNELNDQHYNDVKNNCWKEERGNSDYVIVCDADEFLDFVPNPTVSCPTVTGYNMINEGLPFTSIFDINTGFVDENYSKQVIFDPNRVEEINFVHGCHRNNKTGDITTGDPMRLLHYRQIGGVERMITRHQEYRNRMSNFNKKHGMGIHYLHSDDQKRVEWDHLQTKATTLW
jgi:glycosyltransferase involved in cell wall biosynthesis